MRCRLEGSVADSYPSSLALRTIRSYICGLTRLGFDIARDTVEGATPTAVAISVRVTRRWIRRSGSATEISFV
jgi:hypothetical protein